MFRAAATALLTLLALSACNGSADTADPAPATASATATPSATPTPDPTPATAPTKNATTKPKVKSLPTAGRECTVLEEPLRLCPGHNLSIANRGQHLTEVREMQSMINGAGDGTKCISEDGDFGPVTKQAVTTFQTKNDLVVDGLVGEETWNQLNLLLSH